MDAILVCTRCLSEYPEGLDRCPKDGAPLCEPEDIARLGQQFSSYHFEHILGVGGMGVVYKARHITLNKPVAIKVLSGRQARHKRSSREMLREAQAASRIHHPHIVDVTDFGSTPDGAAFLVMEYLEGESLNTELLRRGRLPVERSANIASQVAGALGAAHRAGIVHRDLKPENIFLLHLPSGTETPSSGDFVKVLDFGLAKAIDMEPSERTKAGLIAGTPAYMSPEQARGREIDGRSDIYSLGVLLYRMTTGVLPFKDEGPIDMLLAHAASPVVPPSERCAAVGPEMSRLIVRCLQKSAADRFQNMEELVEELRRARAVPDVASSSAPASQPAEAASPPAAGEPVAAAGQPVAAPPVEKPTVTREIVDRVFASSLSGMERPASGRMLSPLLARENADSGVAATPPMTSTATGPISPSDMASRERPGRRRLLLAAAAMFVSALAITGLLVGTGLHSPKRRSAAPASSSRFNAPARRFHARPAAARPASMPHAAVTPTSNPVSAAAEQEEPPKTAPRPRTVKSRHATKTRASAKVSRPPEEQSSKPPVRAPATQPTAKRASKQSNPSPGPPSKKGKYVDWVVDPF